ncbi:MAG: hypothetical protein V8T09_05445 [Oscillospiraceae bacterium]
MEEHTQSTPIDEPPLRRVTMEQLRRSGAGVGAAEDGAGYRPVHPLARFHAGRHERIRRFGISENAAAGIGLCVLLALVAIGVAPTCAAKVRDFDFGVPFETDTASAAW